ncbi:glycosyltransferase family 4 protein [Arthrobacter bambusae]|uniref:glycosyltransferase family 4 protein n=1 Tax=Arthrobacter bambusae TaxID=1338426 RepID=UPI0027D7AF5C|nr:glycosyltransferase [Arthrobacter bambusae]
MHKKLGRWAEHFRVGASSDSVGTKHRKRRAMNPRAEVRPDGTANSKLRVIHVGPSMLGVGGIETVIRTYVEFEWSGLEFQALSSWNKTAGKSRSWESLRAAWALIRSYEPGNARTIAHFHLSHQGSFVREGALLMLARTLGLCAVATIHGSAFVSSSLRTPWRWIYPLVLAKAHAIGVLNESTMASVNAMTTSVPVYLVQNPGPVSSSSVEEKSPATCSPTAVFAGTVGRRKGVDTLLSAWAAVLEEVPGANLEIWGPIEDSMKGSPGSRHFRGPISAAQVSERLRQCRVAVLPSTAEAMPMFILEAMGAGRPSVVTDVGAMPIQIGGGGTVVPVGNVDRLAQALIFYLVNPEIASEHGLAARKRYEENFNLEETESELRTFYQNAIATMKSRESKP